MNCKTVILKFGCTVCLSYLSQWKKPLTLYGDSLQRRWNMLHTWNCSLHWIIKSLLLSGSRVRNLQSYSIFYLSRLSVSYYKICSWKNSVQCLKGLLNTLIVFFDCLGDVVKRETGTKFKKLLKQSQRWQFEMRNSLTLFQTPFSVSIFPL